MAIIIAPSFQPKVAKKRRSFPPISHRPQHSPGQASSFLHRTYCPRIMNIASCLIINDDDVSAACRAGARPEEEHHRGRLATGYYHTVCCTTVVTSFARLTVAAQPLFPYRSDLIADGHSLLCFLLKMRLKQQGFSYYPTDRSRCPIQITFLLLTMISLSASSSRNPASKISKIPGTAVL